jgi:hypothetical protein
MKWKISPQSWYVQHSCCILLYLPQRMDRRLTSSSWSPLITKDDVYVLAIPSAKSANPNQAVFACFNLGPDLTDQQTGPYGTLYVILAPGATQVACPDGSLRHDHVLSAVPGVEGYVPFWRIILATAWAGIRHRDHARHFGGRGRGCGAGRAARAAGYRDRLQRARHRAVAY